MRKWFSVYACRKCGHLGSQIRKDYSRTCNKFSDTESPGAGTLFHKVKFGLLNAFHSCFGMAITTKGMSALQAGRRYGIRPDPDTAWVFMHKVQEAMKPSGNYPMDGDVHVDEGRWERTGKAWQELRRKEKKGICAVQLTKEDKVRRFYGLQVKQGFLG